MFRVHVTFLVEYEKINLTFSNCPYDDPCQWRGDIAGKIGQG